jgi:positive regulator of sigma E activity
VTEQGIVTAIDGKIVSVVLRMMEGCASCVNSSCKTNRTGVKAYNRDNLALAEGDTIEIKIEGKAQLSGALWVLGLPMLLFIAGYFIGRRFYPDSGEGPAVLFSVAALALGTVAGILVQKGKKLDSLPRVVKRVDFSEFEPGPGDDSGSDASPCGYAEG